MRPRIIFLVGPTASGKTKTAVELAKKLKGEIISCDSMQLYKGMDIITSKPDRVLMRAARHHLIGSVSPEKEYNVSRYCKDVRRKIKDILKRKRMPLVVGGTGLYMSILVDGLFKSISPKQGVRARLYKEAEAKGSGYLHSKLKEVDPPAAMKIHPNDTKRIVRALEVFESTAQPISKLQKERNGLSKEYEIKIFGLDMPRDELYKRIDDRVDKMFSSGLVDEVKRVLKLKLSKTSGYAIGVREIKSYLGGEYDLEEAKRLIKRNTRQYAKRQMTWFRKDKRIDWIRITGKERPAVIADKVNIKLS
ncbi:MAG: tRNA (adenosine(37)-N6)-dimethylallyltransferase MiaA [Candidatus Omnitrophica bacterium]|nr:tRNA (adenosine(37)-N6)-dimethylallyltransferase MiaA [Candidatus Omnitrophota bacterium]MDD5553708.1 tRNA (adenosine(37)-N6)-dimethylallyltransferase MiaA [Candidatus Omnitrophota bacterium]